MTYHIVVLILFLLITHYLLKQKTERFIPAFSLVIDEKPENIEIVNDDNINTRIVSSFTSIPHVIFTQRNKNKYSLSIQKSCDIDTTDKSYRLLAATGDDVLLYFVRPIELPTKNITDDGVVIGYVTDKQKQLIDAVYTSFKEKIPVPKYKLKKISSNKIIDKNTFLSNGIDCITLLSTKENITPENILLKFTVPDYGELLDVHKLAITLPLAKHSIVDFSILYPQLRGKSTEIKTVITFEILIGGHVSLEDPKSNVIYQLKAILDHIQQPASLNHYSRFLKPYKVAEEHAREHDIFVTKRDNMQVLEQFKQFQELRQNFPVNENIQGFYDSNAETMTLYNTNTITRIPLRVGVRFHLKNQEREEQNGIYTITNVNNKYSILKKELYKNENNLSNRFEPGYLCYDHPEIISKGQCESEYDEFGKPKKLWQKTFWDKPCELNSDCPFYQANKNYPNYRGGCIDGRCEMPIGVEPVSYRKFNTTNQPFCHGCQDPKNPRCCEEQKNRNVYPHLKSPDYAFELDAFERTKKI